MYNGKDATQQKPRNEPVRRRATRSKQPLSKCFHRRTRFSVRGLNSSRTAQIIMRSRSRTSFLENRIKLRGSTLGIQIMGLVCKGGHRVAEWGICLRRIGRSLEVADSEHSRIWIWVQEILRQVGFRVFTIEIRSIEQWLVSWRRRSRVILDWSQV